MTSSLADFAELGKMLEDNLDRLKAMLRRRIDTAPIDPDEILNETYLLARRKFQRFKEQGQMSPYAWLYRLALDCLIQEWRKRYRQSDRGMPLPEDSSLAMVLDIAEKKSGPSTAAVREERRQQVLQALAQLKEGDHDILWMRHFDELSFKDIAAVLDITENTAAARYVRAARRLRDLWRQLHPGSEASP
jgi:RNA polymerase sigma-70 factor (ECF subfamily)